MECPHCTATLPDDDVFCEECGVRLIVEPPPVGGCECGAGPDEIDEDGFCGRCGKRVRPRPEDHIETAISPDFAAVSDRGLRHEHNEDRVFCGASDRQAESLRRIMVVCDGVSSSTNAEAAASVAVEAVSRQIESGASMEQAFAEAATRVGELGRGASIDAPSTTAVAALVYDCEAVIGWVGDSRAYWIDAEGARQMTRDHSWMNDVIVSGEMSLEQAAADPRAHGITRWLGGDSIENAQPDIIRFEIPREGALLLCTDGLWNYAPTEEEMAKLVNSADGDALAICRGLVEFAKQQGGQDNVTAALLKVGEASLRIGEDEDGERIQG